MEDSKFEPESASRAVATPMLPNTYRASFEQSLIKSNASSSVKGPNEVDVKKYKNIWALIRISVILSISSFTVGYSLGQISSVPIKTILNYYNITIGEAGAQGALVGIMPVGGMFGALVNLFFLKYLTRKQTHYVLCLISLISTALVEIPNFGTILAGRFILGFCCGVYTAVAPSYVKQISPKSLSPILGSLFSLGRVIGIVFCYVLAVIIFSANTWRQYQILMFALPGCFTVIQSIGIYLYVPDSPVEMVVKQRIDDARSIISDLYQPQYVQQVLEQYVILKQMSSKASEVQASNKEDRLANNKIRAFIMAVHISIYRNLIGVNTLVAYSGVVILTPFGKYVPIIINVIQLITTFISTFQIAKMFGRRPLYLWGNISLIICNLGITLGFAEYQDIVTIVFMALYMGLFGLLFGPIIWAYTAEIIPPTQSTFPNFITWLALAIATIFPPLIGDANNGNQWPVFAFYTCYCFVSQFYMMWGLKETKGLTYQQIIVKF